MCEARACRKIQSTQGGFLGGSSHCSSKDWGLGAESWHKTRGLVSLGL